MSEILWLGGTVYGLERCPQCGVASPLITTVSEPSKHYKDSFDQTWYYFTCLCSKCKRHILFYGFSFTSSRSDEKLRKITVADIYPGLQRAADEIPERAKKFLQQAFESRHAPDGALMLAASSIDSMLKDKGYKQGSLYNRIEKSTEDGLLTAQMRDWAHEIRLSANEPRHADDEFDGATEKDAEQAIEFARALAEYLYVLPARVQKWKAEVTP